jgi:ABC-type lipoprotein release transport system permease subunit
MSLLFSAWQLVIRRSLANWHLLSTVVFGVLIAVALLSSTPLYSNVINDLGLNHTLQNKQIELLDLHVYVPASFVDHEDYASTQLLIDRQVSRNIRTVIRQEERWIKTQNYYVNWPDHPVPPDEYRPSGHFHVFTNLEEHITLIEGQYASPSPSGLSLEELQDPDFAIEGMIGSETAELFNVGVGDYLIFSSGYGDDEKQIAVELTAIIDPIDSNEEYWFLNTDIFTVPINEGQVAPIFIPEQTLFEVIARYFPNNKASYNWFYFVDIDNINTQNAVNIKNAIDRMERQLLINLPRSGLFTVLDGVISDYQGKLMYTQIPLFLIVVQIIAIVLYYLVTVANMLIERQSGEIALFRSRGASTWQIIGIYFMEGLMISAIGAAAGPFLGAFVFGLLGKTAPFLPLTDGEFLPIRFSNTVFLLATIAAVLCLLAFLLPAIQAARRGVVHQRQSIARPPRAPLWQRFYLDLVLLAFGGILYWELKTRGSLLTMDVFGDLGTDPLLLITPILLLLAVAIVFLRLFPIIIGLATRFSRYIKNTPVVLGLWYMARNPVHYTRLILLLITTASVGMFSATFLGTLERSYDERVSYTTGSDIRLVDLYDINTTKEGFQQRFSSITGVEGVSLAYRDTGRVGTMFDETPFNLLAVDPDNLSQITWYREDFSDKSITELMDILATDEPSEQGLVLPDGANTIGLWVYPQERNPYAKVSARIKDGQGRYNDYEIGTTNSAGWQYLETKITALGTDSPPPSPLNLSCIYIEPQRSRDFGGSASGLYFDNLQVKCPSSSTPVIIEDFEEISKWTALKDDSSGLYSSTGQVIDSLVIDHKVVHDGAASGLFSWVRRNTSETSGIYPNVDKRPMSVIVSRSFLENARVTVNDLIQIRIPGQFIQVEIMDVVDYFPTLDPADKGFIIANLDRLYSIRSLLLSGPTYTNPNEVWLKVTDNPDQRESITDSFTPWGYRARELYDKEAMTSKLKEDPLAGAGWSGVLIISFLSVILVSSLGFIVYSYLSAQARQLDFVILRTLGFSLRQIIGLVCFEQLFIILAGLGIGTLLGERLSYIMMPFLQLTEQGERVLPPFMLTIDWGTIGIAYIIITIAFIITISLVILYFSKAAISQTLRMGDL